MSETRIEEAEIIAWIDGELDDADASRVAQAVTVDPELAKLADAHRRMKTRFAAAFGPIADTPVAMPAPVVLAPIISLAAVRAEREAKAATAPPSRRWVLPGAIAASLIAGVLTGHRISGPAGLTDTPDVLALSTPIAQALDKQVAGSPGPIQVALSFKDHDGNYCRSFTAAHFGGVACRGADGWALRYASPRPENAQGDYRMAGADAGEADVIGAMILGDPLDAEAERKARTAGWSH